MTACSVHVEVYLLKILWAGKAGMTQLSLFIPFCAVLVGFTRVFVVTWHVDRVLADPG